MTKVLLVAGSAPCVLEDLENAKRLYPDHEVMLVNGACTIVKDAQHMLAGHTNQASQFTRAREARFPDAPPLRVHANWARVDKIPLLKHHFPSVTDWWDGTVSSGATSAGKAAMIGLKMGFCPIVLCGCPMDGSGYHPDTAAIDYEKSCQRVGDPKVQERRTIRRYRETLASLARADFAGKVFSMSGFTKTHLGLPPGYQSDWLA